MSLTLYFHPLSSFCQKVLVALYENDTPFAPRLVDLGDESSAAALRTLWPIGKFPVLRDEQRRRTVAESSIIIEYLDQHYPGRTQFLPTAAERALEVRLCDRFYDLYVSEPMQKIIGDRLRPAERKDSYGVEQARARLAIAYAMIDQEMQAKTWATGDGFTLADCAAAPALFYADKVLPFGDRHPHVTAYFARLKQRPSYARALNEAQPYVRLFPAE
jgi:glutathione S-transferase